MPEQNRSEGQAVLEQLLETRNTMRAALTKLDLVMRRQIGNRDDRAGNSPAVQQPSPPKTVFFEALRALEGELSDIAKQLEKDVAELERAF